MRKAPCKKDGVDCPRRSINCHSVCEEYIEFAKEREEFRQARYAYNNVYFTKTENELKLKKAFIKAKWNDTIRKGARKK